MNLLPAQPATDAPSPPRDRRERTYSPPACGPSPRPSARATGGSSAGSPSASGTSRGWTHSGASSGRSSTDPTLPFDQALIKVDPDLNYSELMQVIDVFSRLKVNKISFAELSPQEEAGP